MAFTAARTITAVGLQSDADTVATSYVWPGKTQQFNIVDQNVVVKNRTQNLSREAHSIDRQRVLCRGNHNLEVQNGIFLKSVFGTVNRTGSSAPYTHTFTTGNTLPNLSFYHEKLNDSDNLSVRDIYTGAKINSMNLTCSEGGYLIMENDVWAIKYLDNQTAKSITASAVTPFRFADIVNGEVSVNSVNHKIMSYQYTRGNNLIDEQAGEYSSEFDPQQLDETLTLGVRMRKTELRALRRSAAEVPIVIRWQRGANDYIQLTHTGKIVTAPEDTGVEGTIDVSISFEIRTTTAVVVDSTATYNI